MLSIAIEPHTLLDTVLAAEEDRWDAQRVIAYHLGVGAGEGPAGSDLHRVYERDLQVLPTFAASITSGPVLSALSQLGVALDRILHAGHALSVPRPLPTVAEVRHQGRVAAVWDTGRAAMIDVEFDTLDRSGQSLARNLYRVHVAGAGGFGGVAAPEPVPRLAPPSPTMPAVAPVQVPGAASAFRVSPAAAATYRLIGDRHPLHIDPAAATAAGFAGPILPGLCTLGAAVRTIMDSECPSPAPVAFGLQVRFAGIAYPGEMLTVHPGRLPRPVPPAGMALAFGAEAAGRGAPVLADGVLRLRP